MASISVVVPVYYNEASLPALWQRLDHLAAAHHQHTFEFIFVDDGSGDGSYRVLRDFSRRDARVRVIKLSRNFGSNAAILAGITHARGDCVGFVAADLQDPPEALGEMVACWEAGHKVVLAVRRDRAGDPWLARIFAGVFNRLLRRFVFRGFPAEGVGFFLIDRQVAEVLMGCHERNAHLIGLILWSGFAYCEVGYDRAERQHGKSRWTFGKKIKYFVDAMTAFSYLPLRLASILGLLLSALGGVYALALVVMRLLNQIPVQGFTALMVVVLLMSGVQLTMLGIIGEYIWRSLEAARQRPIFVVDTVLEGGASTPDLPDALPARARSSHEEV